MEKQVSAFLASLASIPTYSESTRLAYASDLRAFLDYLKITLGREPVLADLNANQVAGFLEYERQLDRRQSTLIRRKATLRRFTLYLGQQGLLPGDALAAGEKMIDDVISMVSPGDAPQCLTFTQVEALLSAMETSPRPRARRDQAILMLLLETGLSVGHLISLELTDLNLRVGRMHVTLENGNDRWLSLGLASRSLESYLKEGRPNLNDQPDEKALFISQLDGRMTRQGIWQILRHWGRRITPPIVLSPRLVRHTAAHRMAHAGRPITEIQALLGHRNPLSTQALIRRLGAACPG